MIVYGETQWEIIKNTCASMLNTMVLMICDLVLKMQSSSVRFVVELQTAKTTSVDQSTFSVRNTILLEAKSHLQKTVFLFICHGSNMRPNDPEQPH